MHETWSVIWCEHEQDRYQVCRLGELGRFHDVVDGTDADARTRCGNLACAPPMSPPAITWVVGGPESPATAKGCRQLFGLGKVKEVQVLRNHFLDYVGPQIIVDLTIGVRLSCNHQRVDHEIGVSRTPVDLKVGCFDTKLLDVLSSCWRQGFRWCLSSGLPLPVWLTCLVGRDEAAVVQQHPVLDLWLADAMLMRPGESVHVIGKGA